MESVTKHENEINKIANLIYSKIHERLAERANDNSYANHPEFLTYTEIKFELRAYRKQNWHSKQIRRIIGIQADTNCGYLANLELCTTSLTNTERDLAFKVSKPFFKYLLEYAEQTGYYNFPSERQLIISSILADLA